MASNRSAKAWAQRRPNVATLGTPASDGLERISGKSFEVGPFPVPASSSVLLVIVPSCLGKGMRTFLKPSLSSELRPQDQVYPLLTIGREATSNCSRTASSAFCFVAGRKSPAGHDRLSQRVRRRRWRSQRRLAAEAQEPASKSTENQAGAQ